MKLAGKKALITGGNSGIGLATARLFVSEGAEVAITGRDRQTLDEAVAELGPKAHGYRADVTVAEDRKKLFAELAKDFGKLDIVFANAGISGGTPTGFADEAIFENVIRTNLNGAFFTVNSAAPLMNDNGSIIFNGSVQSYLGQPGVAAYAATKGGLVSMARSIAADLAQRKIRVNVVAPGATKTPIWKRGGRANATAEESAKVSDFFSSRFRLAVGASRKIWPRPCFFLPRTIRRTSTRSSWWWMADSRALPSELPFFAAKRTRLRPRVEERSRSLWRPRRLGRYSSNLASCTNDTNIIRASNNLSSDPFPT